MGDWARMCELSTLKPLSDALGVSINELLSGEKITGERYMEKLEENMVEAIDNSDKMIKEKCRIIYLLCMVFGLFLTISAISMFPSESSWCSIYSAIGVILFLNGVGLMCKIFSPMKQMVIIMMAALASLTVLLGSDYLNVKLNHEVPRFRYLTITRGDVTIYKTLFYDVYWYEDEGETYYKIIKTSNTNH